MSRFLIVLGGLARTIRPRTRHTRPSIVSNVTILRPRPRPYDHESETA